MAQETLVVDPNEDLDAIIGRLRQSRTKDVLVVLPNKTRALETLDQFNLLRKTVREEGYNVTFSGGNKTVQGLAKLLGFQIDKGDGTATATMPAVGSGQDALDEGLPSFLSGFSDNAPSQPQATRPFGGPPQGFVMGGNPSTANGMFAAEESTPPRGNRSAQDIFSGLANMQTPDMPTRPVPPPTPPTGMLGGDMPLTRENAANFFGSGPAIPNPPPPPPLGDDPNTGSRTMSYEEAAGLGLLAENAARAPGDFPFDINEERDDDVPSILDTNTDTAAADFRQRSGVRRSGDTTGEGLARKQRGKPNKRRLVDDGGYSTKPLRSRPNAGAMLAGLTAGMSRVTAGFNRKPKAERIEGIKLERPTLPPEVQAQRRKQSSSYMFLALIGIIGIVVIVAGLLMITLGGGNNGGGSIAGQPAPGQRVNLVLSTMQVTNTVSILLDTKAGASPTAAPASTSVSGSASSVNPSDQTQAGGPGRLGVTEVNTGNITKKGEWPAFGTIKKAEGLAQGQVTIYNVGVSPKSYPAGFTVYTNPKNKVEYKLINALSVGAGDPVSGARGQAAGQVQASVAGLAGNSDPLGRVVLGDSVVAVLGAMSGGTERTVQVVSKEDRSALEQQLVGQAQDEARQQVNGKFNPDTQAIQFLKTADPKCAFTKNPGEEADKFSGECSVAVRAIIYNKTALVDAVKGTLVKTPGQSVDSGSVKFVNDGQIKEENGRLIYTVDVTARLFQGLSSDDLKAVAALVANKSVDDAKAAILKNYPQLFDVNFGDFKGTLPDANKLDIKTVYDYNAVGLNNPVASPAASTSGVTNGVLLVPTSTPAPTKKP